MSANPEDPAARLAEEIDSLQSRLNSLQENVRLTSVRDEVEDLDTKTNGLPDKIRSLRVHGYAFKKDLEANAASMKERWSAQRLLVLQQITQQGNELDMEVHPVETAMQQLGNRRGEPAVAQPYLNSAQSAISILEGKVEAAGNSIKAMYESYASQLATLVAELDRIDWTMTQVAQATFRLMGTEAAVMAVETVWVKDDKEDKDDPKGVLFLTDQRLLFEQKQEVATKKILFITTEKQKVQKLLWETPIALLENVKPTKQGLFGHEDHLELSFASGAPFYSVHVHINGQDCNDWQALLGRAKSHDFDQERAIAVDQEAEQKVKEAPSRCPSCGGAITRPVLRGMDSITCEYCGYVIRL